MTQGTIVAFVGLFIIFIMGIIDILASMVKESDYETKEEYLEAKYHMRRQKIQGFLSIGICLSGTISFLNSTFFESKTLVIISMLTMFVLIALSVFNGMRFTRNWDMD